jgi:IS5 family transposase
MIDERSFCRRKLPSFMRDPVEQGVKRARGTNRRPETSEGSTQWLWARFPSRSVHAEIQKKKRGLGIRSEWYVKARKKFLGQPMSSL